MESSAPVVEANPPSQTSAVPWLVLETTPAPRSTSWSNPLRGRLNQRQASTLINDSERYGGSAQIFKALTGGDNLRFEEKNKNVGEPFVYTGMVMVCANEPIQTTDNTSGLTRRRLTIEFNRPLYKNSEAKEMIKVDNGVIKGTMEALFTWVRNWVLQMTDAENASVPADTYEMVPSLKRVRNEIMLNSNALLSGSNRKSCSMRKPLRLLAKNPSCKRCTGAVLQQ